MASKDNIIQQWNCSAILVPEDGNAAASQSDDMRKALDTTFSAFPGAGMLHVDDCGLAFDQALLDNVSNILW